MPDSRPLSQSETSRSPLYEKAKAVVEACEKSLEWPWDDPIGEAVAALSDELDEIDKALAALDALRPPVDEAEMRGSGPYGF